MRLPASRRQGRTFLFPAACAAVLGSALALAQEPPTPAAAPAAAAPAKKAAAAPAAAHTPSYSLGVMFGQQLRASSLTNESVNATQLAAGIKDALGGKVELSDADKANITKMASAAGDANHAAAAKFLAENGKKPGVITTASGLQYKVLTPGSGVSPNPTDEVTVNYKGTLLNGNEFDSSYKRGEPAKFPLNRVIPGWSEGVGLMKPGAKYQLWIPPQLGYDLHSPPGIPPGSLLVFEVELISAKPAPPAAAAPKAPTPTPAK
ncbi:MAG TPA: FKBP-type peptidyl-prolyl cis-trans isomerase [Steroidobacteraceae bacterium]|nr:FKBP-type peptidyl-prolyl cis-trans isomerase [Steroidobacteraceae bacterium]